MHDEIARWIAANRFPFPDQTDWPATYVTITNVDGHVRGVPDGAELRFPDIVIVDGPTQRVAEIGEVETSIPADAERKWRAFSRAANESSTGARSFFVYVPNGLEDDARGILDARGISYAGIRTFESDGGVVRVTPVVTPGDAKDHR